jgi:hypothetical protein
MVSESKAYAPLTEEEREQFAKQAISSGRDCSTTTKCKSCKMRPTPSWNWY